MASFPVYPGTQPSLEELHTPCVIHLQHSSVRPVLSFPLLHTSVLRGTERLSDLCKMLSLRVGGTGMKPWLFVRHGLNHITLTLPLLSFSRPCLLTGLCPLPLLSHLSQKTHTAVQGDDCLCEV